MPDTKHDLKQYTTPYLKHDKKLPYGFLVDRFTKLRFMPSRWPYGKDVPHPVRIFRHSMGHTQAYFARVIGVSRQTVYGWETGAQSMEPWQALWLERITRGRIDAGRCCPIIWEARRGWARDLPPAKMVNDVITEY